MLNILPYEEKKKILKEYHLRLAVVSVFAVSALILVSLVLLIPSYMLAVSKYNFVAEELARLEQKQSGTISEKEVNKQIQEVNKKVAVFLGNKKVKVSTPSEMITRIIGIKEDTIKIYSISYEANIDRDRVVLTGKADDRDSLARFVEILKKDPIFTSVSLPIGSYVKSTNIDFSLILDRVIVTDAPKKQE